MRSIIKAKTSNITGIFYAALSLFCNLIASLFMNWIRKVCGIPDIMA